MLIPIYQVDAFASCIFEGNPAAICPLDTWLPDGVMQAIATENNLSETAFFVPSKNGFALRWFTPVAEVDLCGHATLATAHILYSHLNYDKTQTIVFETRSGELRVNHRPRGITMDFPALSRQAVSEPEIQVLAEALGKAPQEVYKADDYLAVFGNETEIQSLKPDMALLQQLDLRGVIVTAPGSAKDNAKDFVSRFFAPKLGIPEDPVTGSAHCLLTPYWVKRLDKKVFSARQVSPRGGDVDCELNGERVFLTGQAQTFMTGQIICPA